MLLPLDPDASARGLRRPACGADRRRAGGRDHRLVRAGLAPRAGDVAIGAAGIAALDDWRGSRRRAGRELNATGSRPPTRSPAAADLARGKDARHPSWSYAEQAGT